MTTGYFSGSITILRKEERLKFKILATKITIWDLSVRNNFASGVLWNCSGFDLHDVETTLRHHENIPPDRPSPKLEYGSDIQVLSKDYIA